jgi:hypothetical protein
MVAMVDIPGSQVKTSVEMEHIIHPEPLILGQVIGNLISYTKD